MIGVAVLIFPLKARRKKELKVIALLRRVAGKLKTIKTAGKIRQKSPVTRPIRNTNNFKEI